jgi:hypothetical protein
VKYTICSLATELHVEPADVARIVFAELLPARGEAHVFADDPNRGGFVDRTYRDEDGVTSGDHALTDTAAEYLRAALTGRPDIRIQDEGGCLVVLVNWGYGWQLSLSTPTSAGAAYQEARDRGAVEAAESAARHAAKVRSLTL